MSTEREIKQAIETKLRQRLTREGVDRSIVEMWEAILENQQGDDPEGNSLAREQAREAERRLWARFEEQERLDAAAPELLEACRDGLNAILYLQPAPKEGIVFAAVKRLQRAIAAAERK